MSNAYDRYLEQHKGNVAKGFYWIRDNAPELLIDDGNTNYEWQICMNHDYSKTDPEEYEAYDKYFYGNNKSYAVVQDFKRAWLRHIHHNPHHWQHWILINDEPKEGMVIIDMPYNYIVEMICDWWAFSWNKGNLDEIFKWYDEHKAYMKLSDYTRKTVEHILSVLSEKLKGENK